MFIRHLKDVQTQSEITMDTVRNGSPPPKQARKWRKIQKRMKRLHDKFMNGQIRLNKYWRFMSHFVGLKV